jgi:hypothetical protein
MLPRNDMARVELLEADVNFHFLVQIFICMNRNTCKPLRHLGNGPGHPPTSIHWSGGGLRQGDTAANVFFNILAARLYRAFSKILDGRGILLGLADASNILEPPDVLDEVVQQLLALAMTGTGLTSQATKNKIYMQPSYRAAWTACIEESPRSSDPTTFSIHDIHDGRLPPAQISFAQIELLPIARPNVILST